MTKRQVDVISLLHQSVSLKTEALGCASAGVSFDEAGAGVSTDFLSSYPVSRSSWDEGELDPHSRLSGT